MKKQIITVVAVALVTVLLFTTYSIFLKDDGIEEVTDPFYVLSDEAVAALEAIDGDVAISLCGYNSADKYWTVLYRFAEAVASAGDFDFEPYGEGGFTGVRIEYSGETDGTKDIEFDSFFKTLYDGTKYAFDGEALLVNGILSLEGKDAIDFELRALSGYDVDGNQVTSSGYPFVFPAIDRSKIAYLTINNSHGKYSIYQYDGRFYFDTSAAIEYNEEMFAQLTTNCRYATTVGSMKKPDDRSWADYGLELKDPATANYTILTTEDADGNYFIHSVYIGKLASTGSYYYGRYIGGLYNDAKSEASAANELSENSDNAIDESLSDLSESVSDATSDVSDDLSADVSDESSDTSDESSDESDSDDSTADDSKLVYNLTKHDTIFYIPTSAVDASIALPQTDIMEPTIMTAITDTNSLFSIEDIRIDYYKLGISALAKRLGVFNQSDNLSAFDGTALTKVISDKKQVEDYNSYSDGWRNHKDTFGGFTSSDGKATYIEAALAKASVNGNYKIELGVLRDESQGAYLPAKITFSKSYDGINWHDVEGAIRPEQSDKTISRYELSFTDEKTVRYIRINFDVPQKAQTYVVFDEIRIFADDDDAQPESAISGNWKLVSPEQYIPEGHLFTYLDMTNFNDFVQSIAALQGERVVACGFSDNGNAAATLLKKDILEKYGLASPETHYSYTYDGVVFDIYVSAPNEEGKYYAYSTYSGERDGKHVVGTTDVIVELSTATAKWLEWDIVEYLDHSLLSMYIVDITEMEITFDGKEYAFDLTLDSEAALGAVTYEGKNYDVKSFKYLYQTILSISMYDEFVPAEDEDISKYPECLRIKIHAESNSPEFVFYRVNATRCYFTVDGSGSYYALYEDVEDVIEDVLKYTSGQKVEKR